MALELQSKNCLHVKTKILKFKIIICHLGKAPEGCDSTMYQSLAITLLACFSTDADLAVHPQMINKIPMLKDIILNAR